MIPTNAFLNILLILFLSISSITAQKKKSDSFNFFGQTIDVIYWDNVEYMCSQSPLSDFTNYRNIFGSLTTGKINPETPVDVDKNYKAKWFIRNKMLCLYDIEVLDGAKNYSEKFQAIEKLTSKKFLKEFSPSDKYPDGAMPASWFSGFIYIKRQPKSGETYCDCNYRCEPFKILGFRNGMLIYEKEDRYMEIDIDSTDIFMHPDKYILDQDPAYPIKYRRRSNCTNHLEDKLYLADNQRLSENFIGGTNDELLWNNTKYMCSESPLSVFDNYNNIYPNFGVVEISEMMPRINEKNYVAMWTIVNDILYFYNVKFPHIQKDDKDYDKEYTSRFQAIEKLTEKKLRQIPSLNRKGIPAEWYSGTLYFKRFAGNEEYYYSCDYDCEPFYKVEFEKGKVKSKEKTSYMIIKKRP